MAHDVKSYNIHSNILTINSNSRFITYSNKISLMKTKITTQSFLKNKAFMRASYKEIWAFEQR